MTVLYTIGHSTRTLEEFEQILLAQEIQVLVDVRRFPGSRRYPHFSSEALRNSLAQVGIEYVHEPELGGRRRAAPDSQNTHWRSEAFRGYADYMTTDAFQGAFRRLLDRAKQHRVVIMCAEAVPWRCHRQLIADAAMMQGLEAIDLFDASKSEPHRLNPQARLDSAGHLIYPAAAEAQQELFAKRD